MKPIPVVKVEPFVEAEGGVKLEIGVAIPPRVRGVLRGMFDIRALWVCDHCGSEVEE